MIAAAALAGGVLLPHLWPARWLTPVAGVFLWTGALLLRAVLSVAGVIVIGLHVPATQLFDLLTHWCLHAVIPFFAIHLGLSGHTLGDVALLAPGILIALSGASASFAAWRAGRGLARWIKTSSISPGPRRSVVVGDPDVLVAAAGIRRPQVVVSTGALGALDDAELAAGLEHEWGHIQRRHRYAALLGQLCFAVARLVPGSRQAFRELHFHLERDADAYAIHRTGDPLALASAICKSALDRGRPQAALANLAGSAQSARIEPLIHGTNPPHPAARAATLLLIGYLAALAVGLLAAAQTIAWAGFGHLAGPGMSMPAGCI